MIVRSSFAFSFLAGAAGLSGCGGDAPDPARAERLAVEPAEGAAGASSRATRPSPTTDARFVSVQPVAAARSERKPAPEALRIERGQHFTYALPPGWRVGEDGQFAVTLIAPDDKALTILVGNAGMPLGYPPEQYVYEKLSALHPDGLRLGAPRAATPASGFERAVEFDVTYSIGGAPCCGVAKWHAAGAYDSATMAMTAALSEEKQWKSYSTWLPSVAEQISALDGAAFGARGVMAQNVQNSTAYAEAARRYREESQRNWQQTTDDRNASVDRRNAQFREDLGAVQAWTNPYDAQKSMELPTTHSYYWIDREGNVVGTDDPSADPNVGSPAEWRSMKRSRP